MSNNAQNDNKQTPFKIQNAFAEHFCTRDWERYIDVEETHEIGLIKKKLLYAFFGPPTIENFEHVFQNEDDQNLFSIGYEKEHVNFITPIYNKIYECRKFSPGNNNICMTTVYVCHVPLGDFENLDVYINKTSPEMYLTPIFKVRKCVKTDTDAVQPCCVYIDEHCREYKSFQDYLDCNKLPKGLLIVPRNGKYSSYKTEENSVNVILDAVLSPQSKTIAKVKEAANIGSTIASVGAIAVFGASLFFPIATPFVIGAGIASAAAGVNGIAASSSVLVDRQQHGQDIDLSDPESRNCWLGIAGNTFGIAAGGASQYIVNATSKGVIISKNVQTLINATFIASMVSNGVGIGNSVINMYNNYVDNDTPPSALEILQLSSSVFFFCHSTVNFRNTAQIIEETQNSVLSNERMSLRSNRHRKIFDKMLAETRRSAGNVQHGNAEVIHSMRHIDNKNDFFSSAIRINKDLNKNKVKISFGKEGTVVLNSQKNLDVQELAAMNMNERNNYLKTLEPSKLSAPNASTQIQEGRILQFSSTSVLGLIDILATNDRLKQYILDSICDFVDENLDRLRRLTLELIAMLSPASEEILRALTSHIEDKVFIFLHQYIKNISFNKSITETISSFFIDGKINRPHLKFVLQRFQDNIQNEYKNNTNKTATECKLCGGITYTN